MANILYTTPDTGPFSWEATNRDAIRAGDRAFEKHAAAFYGRKKGFFKKLLGTFRSDPPARQRHLQRPGFLQGGESPSRLPAIAVLIIVSLVALKALKS